MFCQIRDTQKMLCVGFIGYKVFLSLDQPLFIGSIVIKLI